MDDSSGYYDGGSSRPSFFQKILQNTKQESSSLLNVSQRHSRSNVTSASKLLRRRRDLRQNLQRARSGRSGDDSGSVRSRNTSSSRHSSASGESSGHSALTVTSGISKSSKASRNRVVGKGSGKHFPAAASTPSSSFSSPNPKARYEATVPEHFVDEDSDTDSRSTDTSDTHSLSGNSAGPEEEAPRVLPSVAPPPAPPVAPPVASPVNVTSYPPDFMITNQEAIRTIVSNLGMDGVEDDENPDTVPKSSDNANDPNDEADKKAANEFKRIADRTKVEFLIGKQSAPVVEPEDDDAAHSVSDASVPSALLRSEIFHESATAAIAALLAPEDAKKLTKDNKLCTTYPKKENNVIHIEKPVIPDPNTDDIEKRLHLDSLPRHRSPVRSGPNYGRNTSYSPDRFLSECPGWDKSQGGTKEIKKPLTSPLLNPKTASILETFYDKMVKPSKQISDLLTTIHRPLPGANQDPSTFVPVFDNGYMKRRKNACGALKVIASRPSNRYRLCWTVGVLSSLTSVLQDGGKNGPVQEFSDHDVYLSYIDSRHRALASLLYMSMEPKNRLLMFHSPGLTVALGKVLKVASDESLKLASACLRYLAMEEENRLLLFKVPDMVDSMMEVIRPVNVEVRAQSVGSAYKNKYLDLYMNDSDVSDATGTKTYSQHSDVDDASTLHTNDKFAVLDALSLASDTVSKDSTPVQTNTVGSSDWEDNDDNDDDRTTKTKANQKQKLTGPRHEDGSEGIELSIPNVTRCYDKDPNKFLVDARANIFSTLTYLCKVKDNAYVICRETAIVSVLIDIASRLMSPSHTRAVVILSHLTRHPENTKFLVYRTKNCLHTLVKATYSASDECRLHACYALQNLSCDVHCCQEMTSVESLLRALCKRSIAQGFEEEQLAAVMTLRNLTEEPSCLIPMSNCKNCIATLMQIAHGRDFHSTDAMQYVACDALATITHWFRKVAKNAMHKFDKRDWKGEAFPSYPKFSDDFTPSLKNTNWNQWQ